MKIRPHEYKGTIFTGCDYCGYGQGAYQHNSYEVEKFNHVAESATNDIYQCVQCSNYYEADERQDFLTCSQEHSDIYFSNMRKHMNSAAKEAGKYK